MAEVTIQQALDQAMQHFQSGQLAEAETLYRQILQREPNQPDALHLLGVIGYRAGRHEAALELISRAISIRHVADYHNNLGLVLATLGRRQEAVDSYRRALAMNPRYPEALNNLGNVFQEAGHPLEAIKAYQQALQLEPRLSKAYNGLGNAYQMIGRVDDAITCYREALAITPKASELHNNLGNAFYVRGQWDQAIEAYRSAIVLNHEYPDLYYNLGNVLQMKGDAALSINAYRQALALRPNYPEAFNNLGNAFRRESRLDDAIDSYRAALALRPDFPDSQNNLGSTLKDLGELDEAIEWFDRALALQPSNAAIASNRVYTLTFHPRYDNHALLAEHQKWDRQYAQPLKSTLRPHSNDRSPGRRLRIGYVSPDLRNHVIGQNLLPLLREHDHQNFEIFCYSTVQRPDAVTAQFQSFSDQWRSLVSVNDDKAAEMIRKDQIDILVDLSLHMANHRLLVFARKPAPLAVTFGGYPGTTGLAAIDYRLTDPYLDPLDADASVYAEQSLRLPDSFWCYDPTGMDVAQAPAPNPPPALARGYFTFGCFNNFCKVNDGVLELWAQVLSAVENSRLLMLAPPGRPRDRVHRTLQRCGIDPSRMEFADYQPRKQYLLNYQNVDLGLDTFPYNGHTTSLDSLWMGVPVVSLVGSTVAGRAGWSQLSNLGLTQFAANTPGEVVEIARAAAADLTRLAALRSTLRERMRASPLTDAPRFARGIEAAYRDIWQRWCNNPRHN